MEGPKWGGGGHQKKEGLTTNELGWEKGVKGTDFVDGN